MPLPFNRNSFVVPVSDAIRGAKDVLQLHGSQGSGNRLRSKSPAWSANRDCLSACTRPAKQPIRPPAPAARFPAFDSDNNSKTKLLSIGASSLLAAVKSTDESGWMMRRLFRETVPANQMNLPFDIIRPSVTQHNTELINTTWPKERLLVAKWPAGSRLSASLSSVTENRRLAVR